MSRFSNKFTAGDDYIPACVVRRCRTGFAKPLAILLNLSLRTNVYPNKWKRARIVPVLKRGDRSQLRNYRPISILSNFGKIYEQALYNCIYASVHMYLSPLQHGFVSGRSTITNLACIAQYISDFLDDRGQVDVIYTDISKAFDTINHRILLGKMNSFGFSDSLLTLMNSYLTDRTGYVFYNGFMSREYSMMSGVPQGSNLGPLLFLLYVDDLLTSLSCPALAYADDLKIYSTVTDPTDAALLQHNLNIVADWCRRNKLQLNISKCCKVTYTRKTRPVGVAYHLCGERLSSRESFFDLGVLFDSSLTFVPHIDGLRKSASKALGFVLRTCREFTDTGVFKLLYNTHVLSRLEYASMIWYPIYSSHSRCLEQIQRRFFKFISYRTSGSYPERGADLGGIMGQLNMQSLSTRRNFMSARFLGKLLNNGIDCPYLLSRINFVVPRIATRSSDTFYLPRARTNVLMRSPVYVMCRNANEYLVDVFR